MKTRLVIFSADGDALVGLDGAHGDEHAQRVVQENMALLAARGITDCIVVEYDPDRGGEDANAVIRQLHCVRAEIRQRPDQRREVVDVNWRAESMGDDGVKRRHPPVSVARALRVLHAGDDVANPRTTMHRRPRASA